jgi:hypothetical protein
MDMLAFRYMCVLPVTGGDILTLAGAVEVLWVLSGSGRASDCQEQAEQLIHVAQGWQSPTLLMEAHAAQGNVAFWRSKLGMV